MTRNALTGFGALGAVPDSRDIAPQAGGPEVGHHRAMPRSSAQSDFVIRAEPEVLDDPELPQEAGAVGLPRARLRSNEASGFATRWVMTLTWVVLAALAILCVVGPHIPSGE